MLLFYLLMQVHRVFIDCGHGPNNGKGGAFDPGAEAFGTTEFRVVDKLCRPFPQAFTDQTPQVIRTPELSIQDLVAWLNGRAKPGDLLLAIHMNEGPPSASGVEVVYSHAAPAERAVQAQWIAEVVAQVEGLHVRGSFGGAAVIDTETPNGKPKANGKKGLPLLRDTKMPAFIVEMGFLTNKRDLAAVDKKGGAALGAVIRNIGLEPRPDPRSVR